MHPQCNETHTLSHIGHYVIISNMGRIANANSLHTSAQIVQQWPKALQIAKISWFFVSLWVWHAAYVHLQSHVSYPMPQKGPNVVILNSSRIGDATSLRTDGKNQQSPSKIPTLALFGVLHGLCASPTQCNSFNVTNRTQCDNVQLGLHRGCNQPTYKCSNGPNIAQNLPNCEESIVFLPHFGFGMQPMCISNAM